MKNMLRRIFFIIIAMVLLAAPVLADNVNKVIIASDVNYPDALVSSAVSQKLGIPVILTEKDRLSDDAKSALEDLNPEEVIVVGGPAVVGDGVIKELEKNYTVTRLWGMSRHGTALEIAQHFWPEGSNKAVLIEDNIGGKNASMLGEAKNLANGNPIFLIPSGKIPADVLSKLEEMGIKEVTIVGTKITDNMTSDLKSIGVKINEIKSKTRREIIKKIRHKLMEKLTKNDTLVVVAVGNFRHIISVPDIPQSKSYLISNESEISDLVITINERGIKKVKIVGKPLLAEKIATTLKNQTEAEVDLVVKRAARAIKIASVLAREYRLNFVKKFKNRNLIWQEKIQARQDKIKTEANETLNKAENLMTDYNVTAAESKIQEAKNLWQKRKYLKAREKANKAIHIIRKERLKQMKGNWTKIREKVKEEAKDLRERSRELSKANKKIAQKMKKIMTTKEKLRIIQKYRERKIKRLISKKRVMPLITSGKQTRA